MQITTPRAIVAGLTALLLVGSTLVTTECAFAAQWRGGAGGLHEVGASHPAGSSVRSGFRRGAGLGWRGGSGRARFFGRGGSVGVAAGLHDGAADRLWHAGYWNGGVWNAGWWGPPSTLVVVDVYPSDGGSNSTCWQVQPVYGADGDYLGRQIVNLCQ